jgi:hypothetical protein
MNKTIFNKEDHQGICWGLLSLLRISAGHFMHHLHGKNNRTTTSPHLFYQSLYRRCKLFRSFHLRHVARAIDGDKR